MPYNGYSETERRAKGEERARLLRAGALPEHPSACMLCGDPDVPVEAHSEDYSVPYLWDPPAVYWLCVHCHRHKLHRRFLSPDTWRAFLAHVRRGGYASDLHDPAIAKEIAAYREALKNERLFELRALRPRPDMRDVEWWDALTMNKASLNDRRARPRP